MQKMNLKQKAYSFIKHKIANCEYMPNTFLNETELMQQIGTSRTPIREAISKLEQERLVTIIPQKGVVVAGFLMNEINSVYETRELIETHIISSYGDKINKPKLEMIRSELINLTGDSSMEIISKTDNDFHKELIYTCDNKYFHQLMDQIYIQNHRMRMLSSRNDTRLSFSNDEHIEIIEYILSNKYNLAADSMSRHLMNSKKAIMEVMIGFSSGFSQ